MKKKASYISYVLGVVDSDCEGIIRLEISSRCDKVDTEGFAKIWWPRSRENMYIWIVDVAKKKKGTSYVFICKIWHPVNEKDTSFRVLGQHKTLLPP